MQIRFDHHPPGKAYFQLLVLDQRDHTPIESILLSTHRGFNGGGSGQTYPLTGERGRFILNGREPGSWRFRVTAEGYYPQYIQAREYGVGDHSLQVELLPTTTITLHLVDAFGHDIPSTRIDFFRRRSADQPPSFPPLYPLQAKPDPRNPSGVVITDDEGRLCARGRTLYAFRAGT